jgi:hypothetical protein
MDPRVHVSQRTLLPPSPRLGSDKMLVKTLKLEIWQSKTLSRTFFALGGFTRKIHGVSQLVATIIPSIIRALIRRHLPDDFLKLEPGYEASQLASAIHDVERLELYTSMSGFIKEYLTNN